jgi:hypothetical protein
MIENAGIQHYVPQFLLRNFCGRGKSRLFAFGRATGKVFEPRVRNVGGEHGFYDIEIAVVTISVGPILCNGPPHSEDCKIGEPWYDAKAIWW